MTLRSVRLAMVGIAIITGGFPLHADNTDPSYEGRPMSYWLDGLASNDARIRQVSAHALLQISKSPGNRPAVRRLALETIRKFVETHQCWEVFNKNGTDYLRDAIALVGPDHTFVPWLARCNLETTVGRHLKQYREMLQGLGRDARAAAPLVTAYFSPWVTENQGWVDWLLSDRSACSPLSIRIVKYLKDPNRPKRRDTVDRLVKLAVKIGDPSLHLLKPNLENWVRRGEISTAVADWAAPQMDTVNSETPVAAEDKPLIGKWKGVSPAGEVWKEVEFLPRSLLRFLDPHGQRRGTYAADRHGLIGIELDARKQGFTYIYRSIFLQVVSLSDTKLRLRVRQVGEKYQLLESDPSIIYEYHRVTDPIP